MTPYDLDRAEIRRRDAEDHAEVVIAFVLCAAISFFLGWASHVLFRLWTP